MLKGAYIGQGTIVNPEVCKKKSCIRETKNLSTDAEGRTNTILERLRDLSSFFSSFFLRGCVIQKKKNPW